MDARRQTFWAWWLRLVIRCSTVVICQGKSTVEEVVRLGANRSDCYIVPNPVELSKWYGDLREGARSQEIMFAGWMTAEKGVFDLLEALGQSARLRAQPVLICGKGIGSGKVQQRVRELGLSNVELPGWLSTSDLRAAFRRVSIFVLPSHSEGMPQSVVEALAAGAVVVVGIVVLRARSDRSG